MDQIVFKQARFITSLIDISARPEPHLPEIAFIGRSNVGKSSLLNAVLRRKKLAKISSTPGKTRLINYFLVNEVFYFVDLPGYGFAKLSRDIQKNWKQMIENYLLQSDELKLICILLDSRHDLQKIDLQMIEWLDFMEKPYWIVLTKTDKLPKNKRVNVTNKYKNYFPDHHIIPFSAKIPDSIHNFSRKLINYLN